jgi:hypothetical protein
MKQVKTVTIEDYIRYNLEGNLDNIIKYLQELREQYKNDYIELSIEIDCGQDYYGSSTCNIYLKGTREETKEEESKRLLEEELYKTRIKENDLRILEELKRKYEQPN